MQNQEKNQKKKASKVDYLKRIYAIQGWIIEGVQPALIIRQILTNEWCQSQRHAERMLKAARDLWTEIIDADISQKRKLKISELQQLKRTLQEKYKGTPGGIRAIMSIEKQIIEIEGLKPPTKVSLTDPDGNGIIPSTNPVINVTCITPAVPISESSSTDE